MMSGALQAAITKTLNGRSGLAGWRWLFVINAVITVVWGFAGFFMIPDLPNKPNPRAVWFRNIHAEVSMERLARHGRAEPKKKKNVLDGGPTNLHGLGRLLHLDPLRRLRPRHLRLQLLLPLPGIRHQTRPHAPLVHGTSQRNPHCRLRHQRLIRLDLGPRLRRSPHTLDANHHTSPYSAHPLHHHEHLDHPPNYRAHPRRLCLLFHRLRPTGYGPTIFAWLSDLIPQDPEARSLIVGVAVAGYYAISAWSQVLVWPASQTPLYRYGWQSAAALLVLVGGMTAVLRWIDVRFLMEKREAFRARLAGEDVRREVEGEGEREDVDWKTKTRTTVGQDPE